MEKFKKEFYDKFVNTEHKIDNRYLFEKYPIDVWDWIEQNFIPKESVPIETLVKPQIELCSKEIKRIALEIEKDFAQKYSWLFKQILDTYGRDSIKMITRYFAEKFSRLPKRS